MGAGRSLLRAIARRRKKKLTRRERDLQDRIDYLTGEVERKDINIGQLEAELAVKDSHLNMLAKSNESFGLYVDALQQRFGHDSAGGRH